MNITYTVLMALLVCSTNSFGALPKEISPNDYRGSDTERIQQAIEDATETTCQIRIPSYNANGTNIWMIDSAILLPSNIKLILDNCTIQLSDQSRDNMFRSDNVGLGISDPIWNENIDIIGVGDVTLRGADHPRATGDGARKLVRDPQKEMEKGNYRVSYGRDAGNKEMKQTGDWRNILILIAYVNKFTLKNVKIENTHAWSVSFERTLNANLSNIRIENSEFINIEGKKLATSNKDGINLRQGCKYFRIDNISGKTGDDFIALSNLDVNYDAPKPNGSLNSTMVTSARWYGPEDDIEQIVITNVSCENRYRGIAIRASGQAGIHDVYINGLIFKGLQDRYEAILLGGKGYGKLSLPGKINNIYALNVIGNGRSLVRIEAPVHNCHFMNGMYNGENEAPTLYNIDKSKVENITENDWKKVQ